MVSKTVEKILKAEKIAEFNVQSAVSKGENLIADYERIAKEKADLMGKETLKKCEEIKIKAKKDAEEIEKSEYDKTTEQLQKIRQNSEKNTQKAVDEIINILSSEV